MQTEIDVDPKSAFDLLNEHKKDLHAQSNNIWFGLIKTTVTLTTTLMVLSMSFLEYIKLGTFLYLSWIFLFISMFFGIICLADAAHVREQEAKKLEPKLRHLQSHILKKSKKCKYMIDDIFTYYSNSWTGALSIYSFLYGVLFVAAHLLSTKIGNLPNLFYWLVIGVPTIAFGFTLSHYWSSVFPKKQTLIP